MTQPLTPSEFSAAADCPPQLTFESAYNDLVDLSKADCGLQEYVDRYLRQIVELFSARGGVIWFREVRGSRLSPRARCGEDLPLANDDGSSWHDGLLRYAMRQRSAFLARPQAVVAARESVRNLADAWILLGPVASHGDSIALVELLLGPSLASHILEADSQRLPQWLDHLLVFLRQAFENRFLGNLAPLQPALINLEATRAEIEAFKQAITVSLEVTLNSFAGASFGSLQNNKTFARSVQDVLDGNGLRVECPECGAPAILRCQRAGNSKTGVFVYDHYLDRGRTFHGGPTTFPRLKLVPKPPRRNAQPAPPPR
jgi:hypothetical protein